MKNFHYVLQLCGFAIVILLLCYLTSCFNENGGQANIIKIGDNINDFRPLKISEISNSIEYVKLETKNECLIEQIKYLDISDKYIIIHDWNKCLLFSRSGKFLKQIGKKGRGPGEYIHPAQIRIEDDEIFIPDARDHKIKIFKTNGDFIESLQSPGRFTNQFQFNNYLLITDSLFLVHVPNYTGIETYSLYLIDRSGRIIKKFPNTTFYDLEKPRYGSPFDAQIHEYKGKIRYKEMLNDTIWQVEKDSLKPIFIIDRGEFGIPLGIHKLSLRNFVQELHKAININVFWETNRYIFIKTKFGTQYPFDFYRQSQIDGHPTRKIPYQILGIYEKVNNDFFFVKPSHINDQIYPTGIENDYDNGINFMPEYKVGDSLLVAWLYPYEIINYVSSETFRNTTPNHLQKKNKFKELAKSLNENDNPILMLVKLKE